MKKTVQNSKDWHLHHREGLNYSRLINIKRIVIHSNLKYGKKTIKKVFFFLRVGYSLTAAISSITISYIPICTTLRRHCMVQVHEVYINLCKFVTEWRKKWQTDMLVVKTNVYGKLLLGSWSHLYIYLLFGENIENLHLKMLCQFCKYILYRVSHWFWLFSLSHISAIMWDSFDF